MRLLYIDTYTEFGHIALNRVYILSLARAGFEVEVVMSQHCLNQLALPAEIRQFAIPETLYGRRGGRVRERVKDVRILRYIKSQFRTREYDWVFLSSFDEISLWTSHLRGRLLLLAHANVAGMDNPIKRWFMRRIARYSEFVVFHEFIKQRLEDFDIRKIRVEGQGLSEPYQVDAAECDTILRQLDPRLLPNAGVRLIFAPSGAKYQDFFLEQLAVDAQFKDFLSAENAIFVMKNAPEGLAGERIVVINGQIPFKAYAALFVRSECIVLSYPQTFNYRVSAVLLECFSNQKPCVLSDIESFRVFARHFCYTPYFRGTYECINRLKQVLALDAETKRAPYIACDDLNPSFRSLTEERRLPVTSGMPLRSGKFRVVP